MLKYENQARREGFRIIIGVDEAGRGPLAGPVVASAVFLKKKKFQSKIFDSKQLSAPKREEAFHEILEKAYWGVGIVSEAGIDSLNILQATYVAMARAVRQLIRRLPASVSEEKNFVKNACILVDGNSFNTDLPYAYRTIIGGDALSLSIAAASIIAKVTRDRLLNAYDKIFPQYGFSRHKGYSTEEHRAAIRKYGFSAIHRKTFRSSP